MQGVFPRWAIVFPAWNTYEDSGTSWGIATFSFLTRLSNLRLAKPFALLSASGREAGPRPSIEAVVNSRAAAESCGTVGRLLAHQPPSATPFLPFTLSPAALHWPRARSPCAVHQLSHSNFCHGAPQLRQDRCPACWQAWCRQSRGPYGHRSELGGRASGLFHALPSMAVSMDSPSLHAAHSTLHYISGPAWCGCPRGLWPEGSGGSIPPWAPTLGCRDPLPNPHPHPHLIAVAETSPSPSP